MYTLLGFRELGLTTFQVRNRPLETNPSLPSIWFFHNRKTAQAAQGQLWGDPWRKIPGGMGKS